MTYDVHKTCNATGQTHPGENKRTEGYVVCRLKMQRTTGQQSKKTKLCYVNITKNGPTSPPKILEFRKLCYVIYISTA